MGINIEMCIKAGETNVKLLQYGFCNILGRIMTLLLSSENSAWFAGSVRILGRQYSWEFSIALTVCVAKAFVDLPTFHLCPTWTVYSWVKCTPFYFAACFSYMEVWVVLKLAASLITAHKMSGGLCGLGLPLTSQCQSQYMRKMFPSKGCWSLTWGSLVRVDCKVEKIN